MDNFTVEDVAALELTASRLETESKAGWVSSRVRKLKKKDADSLRKVSKKIQKALKSDRSAS